MSVRQPFFFRLGFCRLPRGVSKNLAVPHEKLLSLATAFLFFWGQLICVRHREFPGSALKKEV